jgi:hypothetical protein
VKSAHVVGKDLTYGFRAHDHAQKSYTSEDIDALVRKKRSKYEKWREGWEILRWAVRRPRK